MVLAKGDPVRAGIRAFRPVLQGRECRAGYSQRGGTHAACRSSNDRRVRLDNADSIARNSARNQELAGITRLLACEWAAKGINVNTIAPGYKVSKNTEALRNNPSRNLARIPAGRWGEPHDAAVFLMARALDYVHGAIIPVDGGWLAR